jgi:hypothetical protein
MLGCLTDNILNSVTSYQTKILTTPSATYRSQKPFCAGPVTYEGVSKSFRTGRLAQELQMLFPAVHLSVLLGRAKENKYRGNK